MSDEPNLINEIEKLKNENDNLKSKLKTYTNTERHKKYYENNADIVKEKAKEYMKRIKETNPEKIKEWSHNAYMKKKSKLDKQINDN